MSYKVIVADDSQTIQKVINITLAKQPYHLIECLSEDALFSELEKNKAELVCLDFNLSDQYSGPELAQKIKAISPATQILFLLGTFDTVDDATMDKCGAADKIVKPFDSNKFISICKQLTHQEPGISNPPQETSAFDDLDSQWTVNDTVEKIPLKIEDPIDVSYEESLNALDQEMNDWGMSVPNIIGGSVDSPIIDLPPVIEDVEIEVEATTSPVKDSFEYTAPEEVTASYATPSSSDLEYPEIKPRANEDKKTSKLISIDTFQDYPEEIELEGTYVSDDSDVHRLEELIKDEVEDDLWQVDEFEDLKSDVASSMPNLDSSYGIINTDDDLFPRLDQNDIQHTLKFEETPINSIDKSEIEALVQKYVKDYLDELFSSKIEKIAWDMIPDLAENLIRTELKKISSKVLEDQD